MTPDLETLQEQLATLEDIDGTGTELVSVVVPPTRSLTTIRERLEQEQAAAANIQRDRTRTRVERAVGRARRILTAYETVPEHGLAVYAGVVDGTLQEAVFDDLPAPVTDTVYCCAD